MLTFKLKKDGDQYHAFCPELKGCHTFGSTPDEALKNLKNAVSLYLEDEMEEQTQLEYYKSLDQTMKAWTKPENDNLFKTE